MDMTKQEFPHSLSHDRTKQGAQSSVIHAWQGEIFISLDNGILTLKTDGTWEWSERE